MAIINPNNLKSLADCIEIDVTDSPVSIDLLAMLSEKQRLYICHLLSTTDGKNKIIKILDYGKKKLEEKKKLENKKYFFKNK